MRHTARELAVSFSRRCRRSVVALLPVMLALSGCANLIGSMAADTLSASILNQENPVLVERGLPAYLLLLDGFISQSPDNEDLLAAGAQLYALYGSRFAPDPEQKIILTAKAREYGDRAICLAHEPACEWAGMPYDEFAVELEAVDERSIDYLYSYAVGWLSFLDATSSDWNTVGEVPWVQAAMERAHELDETYQNGAIHTYLGIFYALRPPALGGEPERARRHFERSIELSDGQDLSVKVEFARRYGRLMFDQELHDALLREVVNAPVDAPGYTLFNAMAKQEAARLLESSSEYF